MVRDPYEASSEAEFAAAELTSLTTASGFNEAVLHTTLYAL
jgi:hypothetical protein